MLTSLPGHSKSSVQSIWLNQQAAKCMWEELEEYLERFWDDPPTDGSLKQMQWVRRSSWTVRPKLGIYWVTSKTPLISHLSIREEQRKSVTDPSPDHSSRLADSAAQGLSEPEAMPLYSAALGGFSCHELLSWKRQFSILSNAMHVSHYLGKETPPFVCFELTAC